MFGNFDVYSPCFCGSGKKYKFCCMKRVSQINESKLTEISSDDDRIAEKEFEIGYELMNNKDFVQAIPHFKRAMELNPNNPSSCNNYVLCTMHSGDFDECMPILQRHLAECPVPNPFGMALLSELYFLSGKDEMAKSTALIAANLPFLTDSSIEKLCEAFAYLKMHREIVMFVEQSDIVLQSETQIFFAGIAQANLGRVDEAIDYLSDIGPNQEYSDIANNVLKTLKAGNGSNNIFGEWNYLLPGNFIFNRFKNATKETLENYKNSSWLVDLARMSIEENPNDERYLGYLEISEHPEAIRLLKAIIGWPMAPEKLRFNAISILRKKDKMTMEEADTAIYKNRTEENRIVFSEIAINPDYQYSQPIPDEDEQKFVSLV